MEIEYNLKHKGEDFRILTIYTEYCDIQWRYKEGSFRSIVFKKDDIGYQMLFYIDTEIHDPYILKKKLNIHNHLLSKISKVFAQYYRDSKIERLVSIDLFESL